MSQINPAARAQAAQPVPSSPAAPASRAARGPQADGQVLPQESAASQLDSGLLGVETNTRGHVDTQLGRAEDVLHRSIKQGRTDGAGAREYFNDLQDRGEGHVYPDRAQPEPSASAARGQSPEAVAYDERRGTSANQLDRATDVLHRSIDQGRTDGAGARELFGELQDRARGHVEG